MFTSSFNWCVVNMFSQKSTISFLLFCSPLIRLYIDSDKKATTFSPSKRNCHENATVKSEGTRAHGITARLFKPDCLFIFVTLLDAIFEHGRQFIFQPQFRTKKSLRRKLFSL